MEREKLIQEIEEYAKATNVAPSTLCLKVVNNGMLYKRLLEGGDCGVRALDKLRAHFAANPAPKRNIQP